MIGTILNVVGILAGGAFGLAKGRSLTASNESFFKVALGVSSVWFGLKLTVLSLGDSFSMVLKRLFIVIAALMVGRVLGRLLHLQKMSNRLGQAARERMESAGKQEEGRAGAGFECCALLFCAAPLGIVGSVEDGVSGYFYPLAIKAVMDGLATMGFVRLFGWGSMLSALPVLALQGTITMLCAGWARPLLEAHAGLLDSVNGTGGLIVFSVALVLLNIKRITLADYLPSLVVAPVLAWLVG